jgi:hypothetical protein
VITPGQLAETSLGQLELELRLDHAIVAAESSIGDGWPASVTTHQSFSTAVAALAERYSNKGWRVSHWTERDRVHLTVRKP